MKTALTRGAYLVDGERAINLFPVYNASLKHYEFHETEGQELLALLGAAAIRGLYVAKQDDTKMYCVAGNKFYKILPDGTWTVNPTALNSAAGLVEISDNGPEITITDGTDGYVYTIASDTLAEISDEDFPGGASSCFLNGLTIAVKPGTQQVNCSDLYASSVWNALNFASAEGLPDNLQRCVAFNRQLVLFGVITTEFYFYDGGTAFPFSRIEGAVLGYGLSAKNSLAQNDQAMYFLARTQASDGERVIVEVRGYQPHIVSTQGINELLATLSNTKNAEGFAYMREGHSFYEITFPTDNLTLVYDSKEKRWHERSSLDDRGNQIRHRARCYAYFNGFHMVGDYSTGTIYKMKAGVYTENGTKILRKLVTPTVTDTANNRKFIVPELIVPMKTGVGVANGQGSDPQLMMRYSKDGGNTWSNEKQASFGKLGEYDKRVRFRQLGQMRQVNIELTASDPVEVKFRGPLMIPENS